MNRYKLALVGATGVIGETVRKVLEENELPIDEYKFFASSKSAGKKINFRNQEYSIYELTEETFNENHFDYAIFTAGSKVTAHFVPIARRNGCSVIDNSSFFRMTKGIPLIVPELNFDEIFNSKMYRGKSENEGLLIANPNCSTIQAVIALSPLDKEYRIKRIVYSTYQAISGAGKNAIDKFVNDGQKYFKRNFQQEGFYQNTIQRSDYNFQQSFVQKDKNAIKQNFVQRCENDFQQNNDQKYGDNSREHYVQSYKGDVQHVGMMYSNYNNCVPKIDEFTDDKYTKEEHKMINETRKILKRSNLSITATAVRVPVLNCHSEAINVEFEKEFELNALIDLLRAAPGVEVLDDMNNNIFPMVTLADNQDKVLVGRIRRDYSVKSGINMWVVADNIRKGAATNAVQILEKLCNCNHVNRNI